MSLSVTQLVLPLHKHAEKSCLPLFIAPELLWLTGSFRTVVQVVVFVLHGPATVITASVVKVFVAVPPVDGTSLEFVVRATGMSSLSEESEAESSVKGVLRICAAFCSKSEQVCQLKML